MRIQVRYGVFETNSSMSQTLIIISKKEYEEFFRREDDENWLWNSDEDKWVPKEEVISNFDPDRLKYFDFEDNFPYPYSKSAFDEEMEYEEKEYTTEHGDEIIVFAGARADY